MAALSRRTTHATCIWRRSSYCRYDVLKLQLQTLDLCAHSAHWVNSPKDSRSKVRKSSLRYLQFQGHKNRRYLCSLCTFVPNSTCNFPSPFKSSSLPVHLITPTLSHHHSTTPLRVHGWCGSFLDKLILEIVEWLQLWISAQHTNCPSSCFTNSWLLYLYPIDNNFLTSILAHP